VPQGVLSHKYQRIFVFYFNPEAKEDFAIVHQRGTANHEIASGPLRAIIGDELFDCCLALTICPSKTGCCPSE
jgi:hypothetical protein